MVRLSSLHNSAMEAATDSRCAPNHDRGEPSLEDGGEDANETEPLRVCTSVYLPSLATPRGYLTGLVECLTDDLIRTPEQMIHRRLARPLGITPITALIGQPLRKLDSTCHQGPSMRVIRIIRSSTLDLETTRCLIYVKNFSYCPVLERIIRSFRTSTNLALTTTSPAWRLLRMTDWKLFSIIAKALLILTTEFIVTINVLEGRGDPYHCITRASLPERDNVVQLFRANVNERTTTVILGVIRAMMTFPELWARRWDFVRVRLCVDLCRGLERPASAGSLVMPRFKVLMLKYPESRRRRAQRVTGLNSKEATSSEDVISQISQDAQDAAGASNSRSGYQRQEDLTQPSQVELEHRLHQAIKSGEVCDVKALLHMGAHPDARDASGFACLHSASVHGRVSAVDVLIHNGADVNARVCNGGGTSLHLACGRGHVEIAKRLVSHGASLDALDDRGLTCLHMACSHGHIEVVRYLMTMGVRDSVAASRGCQGLTCLHVACAQGHVGLAQLLIASGSNMMASTVDGFAPIDMAVQRGNRRLVQLLSVGETWRIEGN